MSVSATSLCPGYKYVESFGSDEDYEGEDEVSYVTLDLGSIEPTLVPSSSTCRLIGLDTPTPFLQLSGTILKGKHDSLLGTEMIFTDGKDANNLSRKTIVHVANTEQRVSFKEVRLQARSFPPAEPSQSHQNDKNEDGINAASENERMVDRMTGKLVPSTRAPRTRSEGSKSKKRVKDKGKEKEKFTEEVALSSIAMDIAQDEPHRI